MDTSIHTGTLNGQQQAAVAEPENSASAASVDWSQPLTNGGLGGVASDFDWGTPVTPKVSL